MATLADSIRRSNINLGNISSSLNSTSKSLSKTNSSIDRFSKNLSANTKTKRELFGRSTILRSRREEASRRQELEDELESSKVSSSPSRGFSFASKSEQGPLGRLVGFLSFLTAGWIVENLPTWIFVGQEFLSRIYKFGSTIPNMMSRILNISTIFGETIQNSLDSILRLDFDEFTEGSVAKSFDELKSSIEGLGSSITDTFKLFTTPLTQSLDTGEQAPKIGEPREGEMFIEPGTPSRVIGIHKQALDIISKYESPGAEYNAMNQGTISDARGRAPQATYGKKTSKDIIGKNLTDMTIGEVIGRQDRRLLNDQGFIHAAGRYQIIGNTLPEAMRGAGLKPTDAFSPENQDKMGLYLLRTGGPGKWEGLKRAKAQEIAIVQKARFEPVIYASDRQTQTREVPVGNIKPLITSRYGDPRGNRTHGGSDLAVALGTPLRAISNGVIVDSDFERGWGNFLVMKDNLGIYHLYGHMQSGYKRGGAVQKGEVIGKVGMSGHTTGPHLHWEAGTGWNGGGITGKFDPLNKYSKYAPFNTTSEKAQISPPPKVQQPFAEITPERKGAQYVFIDDTKPSQPAVMYSQESSYAPPVNESRVLNTYIKNKLLLDLAYL